MVSMVSILSSFSMVSMVFMRFLSFLYRITGAHGFHAFHGFYAVSMVSILRLRFPWFPLTLYVFSVFFFFSGLYAVFIVCIIFCFPVSTVIRVHFIFIGMHRRLCLCASFLVRIAGGGAAPSLLHPLTRFYFLIGFPCYLHFFLGTHCGREALRPPPAAPHPFYFLMGFPCYLHSFRFSQASLVI